MDFLFFPKINYRMEEFAKERIQKSNRKVTFKHIKNVSDLEKEELSGSYFSDLAIAYSDTDEDENEGLGDGKIGRDVHDLFWK
jgi:hypothetical protein